VQAPCISCSHYCYTTGNSTQIKGNAGGARTLGCPPWPAPQAPSAGGSCESSRSVPLSARRSGPARAGPCAAPPATRAPPPAELNFQPGLTVRGQDRTDLCYLAFSEEGGDCCWDCAVSLSSLATLRGRTVCRLDTRLLHSVTNGRRDRDGAARALHAALRPCIARTPRERARVPRS